MKRKTIEIKRMIKEEKVIALLAPSIKKLLSYNEKNYACILKKIGFYSWVEVSDSIKDAAKQEYIGIMNQPVNDRILISTMCPWVEFIIQNEYQDLKGYVSQSDSPVYIASEKVKKEIPNAKTIFISPCNWKKVEKEKYRERMGRVDEIITFYEFEELVRQIEPNFQWNHNVFQDESVGSLGAIGRNMLEYMQHDASNAIIGIEYKTGEKECRNMLKEIAEGKCLNCYCEMMLCKKGCRPNLC